MKTASFAKALLAAAVMLPAAAGLSSFTPVPDTATIEDYKGIHDLKIGESYEKVKALLEPAAMHDYYSRKNKEEMKKLGEEVSEEDYGPKTTYKIKSSQKKYFKYLEDVEAKSIEVTFSEDKKISQVIMFFEKNRTNEVLLRGASAVKFGETMCAIGMDTPTFYCPWEKDGYTYTVYDYDGVGEVTVNEFIYVKFGKADPYRGE